MRHWVRAGVLLLALLATGACLPAAAGAATAAEYREMVMADDPAGYWRLEETSGPLGANEVEGGQRLRYFQHPLLDEDGAFPGSRAATAGFRSLLDLGPPIGPGTDATYETWFKIFPGDFGQNYEHVIDVPGDWGVFVIDGQLIASCQTGVPGGGPMMEDGAWHHIAVRHTAGRIEVFVDGTRHIDTTCGWERGWDRVLAGWGGGRLFVKPMSRTYDEMAMYDRALSDERIAAHAAARTENAPGAVRAPLTGGAYSSAVLADEPFSYYRLEDRSWAQDGSASTLVQDSSGNGHHSSLQFGGIERPPGPIASEARNLAMRPRAHAFQARAPASASVTVEVWAKLVTPDVVSSNAWINGGRFGMHFNGVELGAYPWGGLTLLDNLWNDRAWHHIVITKDAANDRMTLYRDGAFHRTIADANDAPLFGEGDPPPDMLIGGGDELTAGFCFDEVAIYEGVLSASRVAAHYDAADAELASGGCGGTPDVKPAQRPAAPVNTSPPRARGIARPGHLVWCDPGEWTGNPTHFRQQWRRDGVDVVSGHEWAHMVTAHDDGHELTCHVVATGSGGESVEVAGEPIVASGRPAPPGTPRVRDDGADVRGAFTLEWEPTPPTPVPADGYLVQYLGVDGQWHTIARPVEPSVVLLLQAEGRLRYRVLAQSGGAQSDPSPVSDPVVIDRGAPRDARLAVERAADWTSPLGVGWYRDSVSATWHDEGDPDLRDGTPGTGVDPATVPGPVTRSTTGAHEVVARLRDNAGNETVTVRTLHVDADPPALTLDCPPVAHVGATANVVVTASDGAGSGLAASVPSLVPIATTGIGVETVSLTVSDNVGHETSATCDVPVLHRRPTAPRLVVGASPGDGAVTLAWSRHPLAPPPAAYVLEGRDADDAGWTEIARGPAEAWSTPPGSPLAQGTWTFRVRAEDARYDPEPSEASDPVVVDRTAPRAPSVSADRAADASGDWFRDTVTVSFAGAGDPDLPDGSPGSGVDPASVPSPVTYSTAGAHTAAGTVRDRAGNTSAAGSRVVRVDTAAPSVALACPATDVAQDSPAVATWTATDAGAGVSGAASGSVALATGTIGTFTATGPAVTDRVGHTAAAATCSYRVIYDWDGFLTTVSNPPRYNRAQAGDVVPVMFSLNGDRGLGVLSGTPATIASTACNGQRDDVPWTLPAAWSPGLEYYAQYDAYLWPFRTQASWRNTCRELVVSLADGTTHRAVFRFR
ncbi:MAG TPA: PxKF domain-containing protein [Solirubrobacteraceae bacterium]|nr:PxKF domain-containing protein [Solirubrobacteraceae bacterium]